MDKNLIIGIAISLIAFIGLFYILVYSARKDFIRLDKEEKQIKDYLQTVVNRISLTTSYDALVLLSEEMIQKADSFKFNQRTYMKWMKTHYYLLGKAHGLRKRTDVNLTIS